MKPLRILPVPTLSNQLNYKNNIRLFWGNGLDSENS